MSNEYAFPHDIRGNRCAPEISNGMTLRDYFAAKELSKTIGTYVCDAPEAYRRLADHCYRMADAMMEARKA